MLGVGGIHEHKVSGRRISGRDLMKIMLKESSEMAQKLYTCKMVYAASNFQMNHTSASKLSWPQIKVFNWASSLWLGYSHRLSAGLG